MTRSDREPQLKYTPLEADAPAILAEDNAAQFLASDKVHALGCKSGEIHVLDFEGHQIRLLKEHKAAITAMAFDSKLERIASCSSDCTVFVRSLYEDDRPWHALLSSVPTCVAIDPHAADNHARGLAIGTESGQMILLKKGWLGNREDVISSGEGRVHCVLWCENTLIWCTDIGTRAYDVSTSRCLPLLPRPPAAGLGRCAIAAVGSGSVLLGWPHCVQHVRIAASASVAATSAKPQLLLLSEFSVAFTVYGIAPYGGNVAVLADDGPSARVLHPAKPRKLFKTAPAASAAGSAGAAPGDRCGSPCGSDAGGSGKAGASEDERLEGAGSGRNEDTRDDTESGGSLQPGAPPDGTGNGTDVAHESEPAPSRSADIGDGGAGAGPALALENSAEVESENCGVSSGLQEDGIVGQPMHHPGLGTFRPQLKIMTLQGQELCADALSLDDDMAGPYSFFTLVSWYPARYAQCAAAERSAPEFLLHKWWVDEDEPLYCVVTPQAVTLGKPCDAEDQVSWLLECGKFAAALEIATSDTYLRPEMRQRCINGYLSHLIHERKYERAAAMAPRLLGNDAHAWERLVFEFGQKQQLPVLAPYVPTEAPQLCHTAYLMVMTSFMNHSSAHRRLLEVVQTWPAAVVDSICDDAVAIISHQINRFPRSQFLDLQRVLAHLHKQQGRHTLALDLYLRVSDPPVFAYVRKFHLYDSAARNAPLLMNVDEDEAVELLVENHEAASPRVVTDSLTRAEAAAREQRSAAEANVWRRRLHLYLHGLFKRDSRSPHGLHDKQVALYAEFDPDALLPFLQTSKRYRLEEALAVCRQHELAREQVFILGRMGRTSEALQLIICELADVPQAIDFVANQGDDALWDELISLAVADSQLTGELLDRVGGYVDPLRLVRAMPDTLRVPQLNARLARIIKGFRTSMQLTHGCNEIIVNDCLAQSEQLLRARQRPLRQFYTCRREGGAGAWERYDAVTGAVAPCDPPNIPTDALAFAPPDHSLGLRLVEQVSAHLAADLGRMAAEEGKGHAAAGLAGMHVISTPESRAMIKQVVSGISGDSEEAARLWLELPDQ